MLEAALRRLGQQAGEALRIAQARKLRGRKGRHALGLTAAVELAPAFGGSLDWLADRNERPGDPPAAETSFDAVRVKLMRERVGIREKALRKAAGLALGN